MADTYSPQDAIQTQQPVRIPRGRVRPALWLVLVIGSVVNVVASVTGSILISSVFGLIVLACIAALINNHYQHRRR